MRDSIDRLTEKIYVKRVKIKSISRDVEALERIRDFVDQLQDAGIEVAADLGNDSVTLTVTLGEDLDEDVAGPPSEHAGDAMQYVLSGPRNVFPEPIEAENMWIGFDPAADEDVARPVSGKDDYRDPEDYIASEEESAREMEDEPTPEDDDGDSLPDATAPGFNPRRDRGINAEGFIVGVFGDDEVEMLIEMAAKGRSAAEIAESLGREKQAIHNKIWHKREEIDARRAERAERAPRKLVDADTVAAPSSLNEAERRINARLDKLGYRGPWTAATDLKFLEKVIAGAGVAGAGAIVNVQAAEARKRLAELCPDDTSPEAQAQVATVLRWRLAFPPSRAAE